MYSKVRHIYSRELLSPGGLWAPGASFLVVQCVWIVLDLHLQVWCFGRGAERSRAGQHVHGRKLHHQEASDHTALPSDPSQLWEVRHQGRAIALNVWLSRLKRRKNNVCLLKYLHVLLFKLNNFHTEKLHFYKWFSKNRANSSWHQNRNQLSDWFKMLEPYCHCVRIMKSSVCHPNIKLCLNILFCLTMSVKFLFFKSNTILSHLHKHLSKTPVSFCRCSPREPCCPDVSVVVQVGVLQDFSTEPQQLHTDSISVKTSSSSGVNHPSQRKLFFLFLHRQSSLNKAAFEASKKMVSEDLKDHNSLIPWFSRLSWRLTLSLFDKMSSLWPSVPTLKCRNE